MTHEQMLAVARKLLRQIAATTGVECPLTAEYIVDLFTVQPDDNPHDDDDFQGDNY